MKHFIGLVLVVGEDNVGWDEIFWVDGPEVTQCEWRVLNW
jgi:hypothetical protein